MFLFKTNDTSSSSLTSPSVNHHPHQYHNHNHHHHQHNYHEKFNSNGSSQQSSSQLTATIISSSSSPSRSVTYYFKLATVILSLLFISTINCDNKLGLIDRNDESLLAEIKDLNNKIDSSEKVLIKLLLNKDVQSSTELKEHVEKILDYLRFRKDGINTWKINYQQFETMRDGINKDYAALPFKIVHILSQATKNKIIHIVPFS